MLPWLSYRPFYWLSAGKPSAEARSGGYCTSKAGDAKESLHATERDSERVRTLRQQYVEAIAARADVGRFYFLDKTGLHLD